jgi:N-carbamoyl-L-amino-acid hydrolase
MHERHDSLQGAARFILHAHQLVRDSFPEGALNCGAVDVYPGSLTIIPGETQITVEFRHPDESRLEDMEAALRELAERCASECRLSQEIRIQNRIPAAHMDLRCIEQIEKACDLVGISHQRLASYASHNAQTMSSFVPTGLMFIPSVNGTSHHPDEYSHWEDVVDGTTVLLYSILNLALTG